MARTGSAIAGLVIVGLATGLGPATAFADADGPDYYAVYGIARNEVLNVRAEPDPQARKVGEIPPEGESVRNLGCKGGLTFEEFTDLSPEQKRQRERENPRWCKVEYQGITGWVNAHYLREGSCRPRVDASRPYDEAAPAATRRQLAFSETT